MTDVPIETEKAALRVRARAARAKLNSGERAAASQAIAGHFLTDLRPEPWAIVAGYWAIRDEVDCKPILLPLVDGLQPVCLPVVVGEELPLTLRLWEHDAPLYPSGFGTLAPSDLAPTVEPDVILMPLLGFDDRGTRLGYGGGYYDRTLAALSKRPLLIGLAFEAQHVDAIPRAAHDVPLDAVITETGVRRFTSSPS